MKQAVLIVALETVPDVAGLRRLHALPTALSDYEVGEYALQRQRASRAGDELPPMLRRIVALSAVILGQGAAELVSLRSPASEEADILQTFFARCAAAPGGLAGWGLGEQLAVIDARSLVQDVVAPAYWQARLNRSGVLTDLAAVSANGAERSALDQFARLTGGAGWTGLDAAAVREAWLRGESAPIGASCDGAALASAGAYLRLAFAAGELSRERYERLMAAVGAAKSQ